MLARRLDRILLSIWVGVFYLSDLFVLAQCASISIQINDLFLLLITVVKIFASRQCFYRCTACESRTSIPHMPQRANSGYQSIATVIPV